MQTEYTNGKPECGLKPRLLMNFGACKGDISGFKLGSLFRSKGGSCRRALGVTIKLWWLEEIWFTELLEWKNLFWNLKWIITNSIRKVVLCKVYPKPCKNKQSKILGSFLRNEPCAHTFSKVFLPDNYVPKSTALICTYYSLHGQWRRGFLLKLTILWHNPHSVKQLNETTVGTLAPSQAKLLQALSLGKCLRDSFRQDLGVEGGLKLIFVRSGSPHVPKGPQVVSNWCHAPVLLWGWGEYILLNGNSKSTENFRTVNQHT